MIKYALALVLGAVVALAAMADVQASSSPKFYPLTFSAQQSLAVNGKTVAFMLTASNSSTSQKLAPMVYLDQVASVAKSSEKLIMAKAPWGPQVTWKVGVLKPGQTKTLMLWYHRIVNFPSREGHTPPPGKIGKTYEPNFTMYEQHYHYYTFVGVAMPASMGK